MVNVQLEDGTVVEMPRNPAEWLAAQKQQWLQEAEQKFQPFTKTVEQLQAERAEMARQQQITQYVSTTEADVKTWPGMDDAENRKAVAEELSRMNVPDDDPREVSLALNAAYRKVMLPKLQSKSESALLENLQRKAAASNTVNPGSAASSSPRAYKSFKDLGPEMWR
jgi:predicted mannosyl-3-phosphoglycerate phosphatase (HAD superfamily)